MDGLGRFHGCPIDMDGYEHFAGHNQTQDSQYKNALQRKYLTTPSFLFNKYNK
jgi:hypothetical protein